jgi:hypothetical protein
VSSHPVGRVAGWILLALAGLALAVALSVTASNLSTQPIGLSGEPLRAGQKLAPAGVTRDTTTTRTTAKHRHKRRPKTTTTPTTTTTTPTTATPAPTITPSPTTTSGGGGSGSGGEPDDHGRRSGRDD